jgi:hypothetical protein
VIFSSIPSRCTLGFKGDASRGVLGSPQRLYLYGLDKAAPFFFFCSTCLIISSPYGNMSSHDGRGTTWISSGLDDDESSKDSSFKILFFIQIYFI